MLEVRALPGTHELVVDLAHRYTRPPGLALDLGAGSGALAERLQAFGFDVWAVDITDGPKGKLRFIQLDLNDSQFRLKLPADFDFITAVEVIEHLESPIAFLTNVRHLLKKEGTAVITTPNVENLPARLRFLLRGKIRAADERAPEHITPIFYDLFVRQYLSRAGLHLIEHFVHPWDDYPLTGRRWFVPLFKAAAGLLRDSRLRGDCHVFVLKRVD